MSETHSAAEFAEKMGMDEAVIRSGDEAAAYLDATGETDRAMDRTPGISIHVNLS